MKTVDFEGNIILTTQYRLFSLLYSQVLATELYAERELLANALKVKPPAVKGDFVAGAIISEFIASVAKRFNIIKEKMTPDWSYDRALNRLIKELGMEMSDTDTPEEEAWLDFIYGHLITLLNEEGPGWSYEADLARWHHAGRTLAQSFYADCIYPNLLEKLSIEAEIRLRSGSQYPSFAYRRSTNVLSICYTKDDSYIQYLRYPFGIMHEYLSHAFTEKTGSKPFEDGWLLLVAESRLKNLSTHGQHELGLSKGHMTSINQWEFTSEFALNGYKQATYCWRWMHRNTNNYGTQLMHKLASLPESEFSHSVFLNLLSVCLESKSEELKKLFQRNDSHPDTVIEEVFNNCP